MLALDDVETNSVALERLSVEPRAWPPFSDVAASVEGYTYVTGVHRHKTRDDVVYLKMVPDVGHSLRVFGDVELADYLVLQLQRGEYGWWRAHTLSEKRWPRDAEFRFDPTFPSPRF
ncbi:MAG: hypothetical protein ACOH2Q_13795 [Rhodococcus sp. (in: high G+C Gram-positive bacteria)]